MPSWYIIVGTGSDSVPLGTQSLPRQMLTWFMSLYGADGSQRFDVIHLTPCFIFQIDLYDISTVWLARILISVN